MDTAQKHPLLTRIINSGGGRQSLVFTRTKHGANRLAERLERDGLSCAAIHGNKSQAARTRALDDFKQGKIQVLVATDIAARGLDITELPHVVNFELPHVPEDMCIASGAPDVPGGLAKRFRWSVVMNGSACGPSRRCLAGRSLWPPELAIKSDDFGALRAEAQALADFLAHERLCQRGYVTDEADLRVGLVFPDQLELALLSAFQAQLYPHSESHLFAWAAGSPGARCPAAPENNADPGRYAPAPGRRWPHGPCCARPPVRAPEP